MIISDFQGEMISNVVMCLRKGRFRLYNKYRQIWLNKNALAPIDINRPIIIDPSSVTYYNRDFVYNPPGLGKIVNGDWDRDGRRKSLDKH